jgi:hypothetical protein
VLQLIAADPRPLGRDRKAAIKSPRSRSPSEVERWTV